MILEKNSFYKKIKKYFEKNAGRISILFFLGGFLFDNLTLQRIDSLTANLVLLSYLFLALFFIFLNNIGDYRGIRNTFLYKIYTFAPAIIQFSFGALFSGYVIFYTRSSSFFDSWPFLLLLYFLFIANEKLRSQYEKFNVQMTIFYFAILSFSIFYIPILFKKMNYLIFILSWIFSLILIFLILKYFYQKIPNLLKFKIKIIFSIFSIILIFNFLYFAKLLPPVPLSVKEIGVYHLVERDADFFYLAADEKRKWFLPENWFKNIFHWKKGEDIYVYASIFAPTGFETDVWFIWYWFNPKTEKWKKMSSYKQHLIGGRDNGYRTKSKIRQKARPGKWKVYLISNTGAVIDRINFEVREIDFEIPLVWKKLK